MKVTRPIAVTIRRAPVREVLMTNRLLDGRNRFGPATVVELYERRYVDLVLHQPYLVTRNMLFINPAEFLRGFDSLLWP